MSRTRLLISLLLCVNIVACGYSFTLDGKRATEKFRMEPSTNATNLIDGGIILDASLERTLASMGMLASGGAALTLHNDLASYSIQTVTTPSLSNTDRYRLLITVVARVTNAQGKEVWRMSFSDTGTYAQGGRAEDALDEATRRVATQIAQALAAVSSQ